MVYCCLLFRVKIKIQKIKISCVIACKNNELKTLHFCRMTHKLEMHRKLVNIFLPINLSMSYGCSKEPVLLRTDKICFG